ncbi:hypothetical protein AB0950_32105 [Streptomyces sp. NPDC007189]|uniref:hypothetical protein n=1 Tax=Streptomyces sp. NPDC007189 TaxID=3154315 RepID=UPI0034571BD6
MGNLRCPDEAEVGRPLKLFLDRWGMCRPSGTADGRGAESADEAAVLDLLAGTGAGPVGVFYGDARRGGSVNAPDSPADSGLAGRWNHERR